MPTVVSRLASLLARHWGKLAVLILLCGAIAAVLLVSPVRARAVTLWDTALVWAGLQQEPQETGIIYWCPMDPQIKRTRPNEVCPICSMALVPMEKKDSGQPPEHLTLTPQQVQQAGVVYQPVVTRKLYREIDTTGRIEYDERRLAGISSWIRGKSRIVKLHVNFTGTRVEEDELMAELYSPELITAQQEFLVTLESIDAERTPASPRSRGADRLRDSPLNSKSMLDSARRKLQFLGMTPRQIDKLAETRKVQDHIPIFAPAGGTVIQRHVQEGQYVQEGDWLFHLADLAKLWVFVDVYEDELPLVEEGQPAELSVRSSPGETFQGTVAFVPPEVQRDTRTARVRIDVPNPQRRLKPGTYARIRLKKDLGSRLAVPHNAVLWSGQRQVAIVRSGEGLFQPRQIRVDPTWAYPSEIPYRPGGRMEFAADRVRYHPVLAGLNPGEEVVTAGAFLLNAESQFQSVLTKMLPPVSRSATLQDVVGAEAADRLRELLESYYALSETLARDELKGVAPRAEQLHRAAEALARHAAEDEQSRLEQSAQKLAEAARSLLDQPPADLKAARQSFGSLSRSVVDLLAQHGGTVLVGRELFVFECPMADPFGYKRWLSPSQTMRNPYMGQKMLQCGNQVPTLAERQK